MSSEQSEPDIWHKKLPQSVNMISLLVERYGPFAFGVVLLLAVWEMVARPQIESHKVDFAQQQQLVTELREVSRTFLIVGEQQKATADVLRTTTELLAKTAQKLADAEKAIQ
jgi:hypothetical protein